MLATWFVVLGLFALFAVGGYALYKLAILGNSFAEFPNAFATLRYNKRD